MKDTKGPLGILSRLFYKALANVGQKPEDIISYVRIHAAKKAALQRQLRMPKAIDDTTPSEAAIQQAVQTTLRSITDGNMTLKTLYRAASIVGVDQLQIKLKFVFKNGVSVESEEIVNTSDITSDIKDD